jgi:hypothetical protein
MLKNEFAVLSPAAPASPLAVAELEVQLAQLVASAPVFAGLAAPLHTPMFPK